MKTVVYSCPFVPAEWIAAHGIRPSRILPRPSTASAHRGAGSGVCPYAWTFTHAACSERSADAVIFTTVCDQMRRVSEQVTCPPVFLMNVPSAWQTSGVQGLYLNELQRLSRFLVGLGGAEPSPERLSEVMRKYDTMRSTLRAARSSLSARQYSEAIAHFHRDGTFEMGNSRSLSVTRGVSLALVGGPLLSTHFEIFDLIERVGGTVVLDATGTGERTMPPPFDRRRLADEPLFTLADAYFGSIPDAFRRPNSLLYQWLKRKISDRGVRGIIFRSYTWCDTWHAEAQRMKEWSPVPLLAFTTDADEYIEGPASSRIESFVEMLK